MIRILEISWLIIAIATTLVSVFQFFTEGWQSAIWMLVITAVAFLMYTVRKKQRIRIEKQENKEADVQKYH